MRPASQRRTLRYLVAVLAAGGHWAGMHRAVAQNQQPSAGQIEEIVVTGLRRESSIMEAPVSVTVFDQQTMRDAMLDRPMDVAELTPGVTMVQSLHPGQAFVTIRGNTQTRLGESSVALVVDGVQLIDQNSVNQELFALESIEVLKGPQGALYGRNAIGGAIVVNTRKPSSELSGDLRVAYATGDEQLLQGSLSGPISEGILGFTIGGSLRDRDGYWKNDLTGERVDRFRDETLFGRLYYTPNDRLSVDLKLSNTVMTGGAINFTGMVVGLTAPAFDGNNTDIPFTNNIEGFTDNDRTYASAKADYEFNSGTLTAVVAYSDVEDLYGSDSYPYTFDPGLFNVRFPGDSPIGLGAQTQITGRRSEITSIDVRYASDPSQPLRYTVGAFYADFEITDRNATGADTDNVILGVGPFPFGSRNQTINLLNAVSENEAYAFYGSVDYDISPQLTVTGSLRYDEESKDQTDFAFPGPPDPADPKALPGWEIRPWRSRGETFSEWQPKLTLSYTPSETTTWFASAGRGFKTGGLNPFGAGELVRSFNPASTVDDLFDKEVADTFEVGMKLELLERSLRINAGAFFTDTENAQLLEFFPGASIQAISTAEGVEMYGGEIDVTWYPQAAPGLMLYAGLGLLETEITKFASNPALEGGQRPSTSPVTANLSASYSIPMSAVGNGGEFFLRADWSYQGETEWDWANTPGAARDSFSLLNLRAAVRNANWEVAIYGQNVLDEIYNAEHIVLIPPVAGALFRAAPRVVGAEAVYRF